MTPEQKLEIVYKKLFNSAAFTKNGTKYFEEPFRGFSQVPLSYVYANSNYIPQDAPMQDVIANGNSILKYVNKERAIPVDSTSTRFVATNGRIIPFSYGQGYGIEIRTQSGSLIDPDEFPYQMDWESGEIRFDVVPFDVDNRNPPLLSYHYYSGVTLNDISSTTQQGQRGEIGPTGDTGPIDGSVLMYKGTTDFTASPAVQYNVNDVITFSTNGNSYICKVATTQSPTSSPSSWELLSVQGTQSQMPSNVLYVNHPNASFTSNFSGGSNLYYSSLQDAIDASPDGVETLIVVNQLGNQTSVSGDTLNIIGKNLNIMFKKWAKVSSVVTSSNFSMRIRDSRVIIQNALIGGTDILGSSLASNDLFIDSLDDETVVEFIDCKINTRSATFLRRGTNNCSVTFKRCSFNAFKTMLNCDFTMDGCMFASPIFADYSGTDVQGYKHVFNVINSFGFQRMAVASNRLAYVSDVFIILDRTDVANASVKLENSTLPAFCIKLLPDVVTDNPCNVNIDCNNTLFYFAGIDYGSAINSATVSLVGSNNGLPLGQTSIRTRALQYLLLNEPTASRTEYFVLSVPTFGQETRVVKTLPGAFEFLAYNTYKSMIKANVEGSMMSL